jgi:hypothetical protein
MTNKKRQNLGAKKESELSRGKKRSVSPAATDKLNSKKLRRSFFSEIPPTSTSQAMVATQQRSSEQNATRMQTNSSEQQNTELQPQLIASLSPLSNGDLYMKVLREPMPYSINFFSTVLELALRRFNPLEIDQTLVNVIARCVVTFSNCMNAWSTSSVLQKNKETATLITKIIYCLGQLSLAGKELAEYLPVISNKTFSLLSSYISSLQGTSLLNVDEIVDYLCGLSHLVETEKLDLIIVSLHIRRLTFCSLYNLLTFSKKQVNCNYRYTSEDVESILETYFRDMPNVELLAGSSINRQANNNSIGDILGNYFNANRIVCNSTNKKTLIIPIENNGNWVGLRVELTGQQIDSLIFYNSHRDRRDRSLMSSITSELNSKGFIHSGVTVKPAQIYLNQPDPTNSGAYFIETVYCDLKQIANPSSINSTIRKNHLKRLEEMQPDFYPGFKERQRSSIVRETMLSLPKAQPNFLRTSLYQGDGAHVYFKGSVP